MEEKSSFSKIMSAASLVTSEPEIPIEIPMSPCLMAGESLTPSPVTPTTFPIAWQALTMSNFWAGVVLAKTICGFLTQASRICCPTSYPSSKAFTIISPWITIAFAFCKASLLSYPSYLRSSLVLRVIIPICLAIAAAVGGWSPVTMITFIPADWHFLIAKGTLSFGGSISDTSPTKTKFYIGKLKLSGLEVLNGKSS